MEKLKLFFFTLSIFINEYSSHYQYNPLAPLSLPVLFSDVEQELAKAITNNNENKLSEIDFKLKEMYTKAKSNTLVTLTQGLMKNTVQRIKNGLEVLKMHEKNTENILKKKELEKAIGIQYQLINEQKHHISQLQKRIDLLKPQNPTIMQGTIKSLEKEKLFYEKIANQLQ